MANVVGVEIVGKDSTRAAMASAAANLDRLQSRTAAATRQTAQLQTQMRGLGQVVQGVGNTAAVFGQQHIANAAGALATITMAGREATQAFSAMNGMLKRSLVGLAAIAGAVAIAKYMEMKEQAEDAVEATKTLANIAREAEIKHLSLANAVTGAVRAENFRHKKALEQIDELEKRKADASVVEAARQQEELRHNAEIFTMQMEEERKRADIKAQLADAEKDADVERYVDLMNTQTGILQASLEGRREYIKQYQEFWMESHRTMSGYIAEGLNRVAVGLSDAVTDVVMRTKDASTAFRDLAKAIGRMFAQWVVNRAIAWVAEKTMAAIGIGMAKAQLAAVAPIAAATAASWAPAATAALIGTYGAAASMGALLPPVMAANQVAASGMALSGAVMGMAHSGMDYVPREGSYILQQGEIVLDPGTSKELRQAALGGGGGGVYHLTVNVGEMPLTKMLLQFSRDGRLTISEKAIV